MQSQQGSALAQEEAGDATQLALSPCIRILTPNFIYPLTAQYLMPPEYHAAVQVAASSGVCDLPGTQVVLDISGLSPGAKRQLLKAQTIDHLRQSFSVTILRQAGSQDEGLQLTIIAQTRGALDSCISYIDNLILSPHL